MAIKLLGFVASLLKNLGLVCGSILITLFLAEQAVRLFWPMDTGEAWRMPAPHGQPYLVNYPRIQVLHRHQNFSTTYSINSFGNRGPEPGNEPEQLIFLGDSFTFGLFIDEQDTSVGQIRRLVSDNYGNHQVGVVNAAIAGSGIAEWVAQLQDYGRRLNPSIVVANLNYVSLSRGYKHPLFSLDCDREILIRNDAPLIDPKDPWPTYRDYDDTDHSVLLVSKIWLNGHSQLYMAVRKGYAEIKKLIDNNTRSVPKIGAGGQLPNMPFSSESVNESEIKCFVKASFKALRDATQMAGGTLLVIDIGYRWQTTLAPNLSIDLIALDFVPEVLHELRIPYVNLTDQLYQLNQKGVQLSIPGDGHPTKNGHLAITKGSWPIVQRQIDFIRASKTDVSHK